MHSIQDSVGELKGVGPKRLEQLQQLGITTIEDLLSYYPFRYEDIQEKKIEEIQDQEKVVIKGLVVSEPIVQHYGYKKNRLTFRLMQDHAVIMVSFFNQPFLKKKVQVSEELAVYGKWDAKRKSLLGIKILGQQFKDQEFEPIYRVNKHIRQSTVVELIHQAFEEYQEEIQEILPEELIKKYRLISRKQAMYLMHFPKDGQEHYQARRRIIFEEFFIFQMNMQSLRKKERQEKDSLLIHYDADQLKQFIRSLPFELTDAQKRVTNEICRDLMRPIHMHRLLQGDVGSGKTVIAAIALYATVTAGYQGALMVPTEILAEQHAESLQELFADFPVHMALLTSSTKPKERQQILDQLASGEINIIVGTHALIQKDVVFDKLGLVITDEQHRFGVQQRQILREKGQYPDVLFMTATPIPRTLAITAFGEMDVSVINELPKGRIPIQTKWVRLKQLETILDWTKKELKKGHQMYVICPLIEESEQLDLQNATEIYESLRHYYQDEFQVGLLHGKMKSKEKETMMEEFKQNKIQVLVSTTVIEVGVNVPNATIMLIMDANRFGLAQLHQLRGRVGRGSQSSYCILVADPKNESGKERMKIMTETTDGFVLSQKDLEMRGPGEFFGAKQSGIPEFQVGDIVTDYNILEVARQEAIYLTSQDHWEQQSENKVLVQYLENQKQADYFD